MRLQEERQSAARGIELLALAQNTLSGAFQRLNEEKQRLEGATSRGPVRVAKAAEAEPDSPLVESPMAVLIPEAAETSLAVSA